MRVRQALRTVFIEFALCKTGYIQSRLLLFCSMACHVNPGAGLRAHIAADLAEEGACYGYFSWLEGDHVPAELF